jgi:transposase
MEVNMTEVTVLGIDLAKNVFQLHGVNRAGRCVLKQRVMRDQLMEVVANLPPSLIGVEACTGAFYWQRRFEVHDHTVKVMAPQYVRPFGRGQKNDGNDAEAICTAVQQPNMRFVPGKTTEQQDIQAFHRARQRLVNHRVALISQMRGLLLERGIAIAKSASRAERVIPQLLGGPTSDMTDLTREIIGTLYAFLLQINEKIRYFDKKIDRVFLDSPACQRIAKIIGVGPKTATAMVAAVGDGADFKNGRHMAAWMGLVPRQHSSGDRTVLLGISKRGGQHLRTLLVHGGRAVVRTAHKKSDPGSNWVNQLRERRGYNRAAVAVANKNARIIWALLRHGDEYRAAA